MDEIRIICQEFIEWLESDDYCEDSINKYENAIYEAAMEAALGGDIWDRVNKAIDEHD